MTPIRPRLQLCYPVLSLIPVDKRPNERIRRTSNSQLCRNGSPRTVYRVKSGQSSRSPAQIQPSNLGHCCAPMGLHCLRYPDKLPPKRGNSSFWQQAASSGLSNHGQSTCFNLTSNARRTPRSRLSRTRELADAMQANDQLWQDTTRCDGSIYGR